VFVFGIFFRATLILVYKGGVEPGEIVCREQTLDEEKTFIPFLPGANVIKLFFVRNLRIFAIS